jgi:hypothetical protein
LKRTSVFLIVLALVGAALVPATAQTAEPEDCGVTTLEGAIVFQEGHPLECGPGQPTVVRDGVPSDGGAAGGVGIEAKPGRDERRTALGSWINIADVQLADEESPLRGEWADKCEDHPFTSAFRPQETMVPHLLNSHVKAAAEIAAVGTPKLGDDVDFVIGLGDLADNQQRNEVRLIIDLFNGGKLVDPDSGADGYDGVQGSDPVGSGEPLASPEAGGPPIGEDMSLLDLANEPFWANGLFEGEQSIPWYSLPGNHDVKVQGTIPDDNPAWRHLVRRHAVGNVKLMDLAPDYQQRLCAVLENQDQDAFQAVMMEILNDPESAGTTKIVEADDSRMPLYRTDEAKGLGDEEGCTALTGNEGCESSWLEEHLETSGVPVGHGYAADDGDTEAVENGRCTGEDDEPLARACYSFTHGLFHFIALDTTPAEGRESGAIDEEQWQWLQRELIDHSTDYFGEDGEKQTNESGQDKLIVIVTHHTIDSTDNELPIAEGQHSGSELREFLLRFPNVIMQNSGHTHENRVYAHTDSELGTGYWELNTAAVVDSPHQSRVIEVANNNDGTLSIFGTIFDALVAADPRDIHWVDHDHTHETDHEADHDVNEDWLASFGREVGYHDPQGRPLDALGGPEHRNVELLIAAPVWLQSQARGTDLTYTGDATARVGSNARVSAVLTDQDGTPLTGAIIRFTRKRRTASAETNGSGVAETTLRVQGPPGSNHPVTVSFEGSGIYLPVEIVVPFTAVAR